MYVPVQVEKLQIKWMKDNKEISTVVQRMTTNIQDNSLTISGTIVRDSGTYTCIATNGLDQSEASAMLTVKGRSGRLQIASAVVTVKGRSSSSISPLLWSLSKVGLADCKSPLLRSLSKVGLAVAYHLCCGHCQRWASAVVTSLSKVGLAVAYITSAAVTVKGRSSSRISPAVVSVKGRSSSSISLLWSLSKVGLAVEYHLLWSLSKVGLAVVYIPSAMLILSRVDLALPLLC